MKITCQACAAKYTIADEKVLGKVVKIRCKKCGATIVINGNDPAAATSIAPEPPAFDYAGQGSASGDAWTVNVADGDQRTMTDQEIATAYQRGVVNDETFCWKDGMGDWLALREIAPLYAACTAAFAQRSGITDPPDDDGATKIQPPPAFLIGSAAPAPLPAAGAHAAARPGQSDGNGSGAMYPPTSPGAIARRSGGRAPAPDLFGGAAQAGSEEDVMTSAPAGMPQAHEDPGKLTGARNENSVLFSLNALTSKGGVVPQQPMTASAEASGLIDIRQLSAQIGIGDDKKQSRLDDIMNLAGGGAFSPSLSAPVLSAPAIEEYAPQAVGPTGGQKSKAGLFLALGAGAFVIVAAIGGALMYTHRGEETADNKKPAGSASGAEIEPSAAPTDSVAKSDTPPGAASAAPQGTASATAEQAAAPTPNTPADTTSSQGTPSTAQKAAVAAPATPKSTTPKEPAPAKDTGGGVPPAVAAAAGGGTDAPFNMGEAKARLAAVAASTQSCKKGDLSGTGRVVVVFAPNGSAQSANISGPPFEGTSVGACVAARFRGVHVPAFSGSPFSVAKSFTIN